MRGSFLRTNPIQNPGQKGSGGFDFRCTGLHNGMKMQKTEKFFIFSWRELLVLFLVAATAMVFVFTLGLHYGKRVAGEGKPVESAVASLDSSPEAAPPKETLEQGAQHSESASHEAIQEATAKAIEENHLKVNEPKPVDLPAEKGAVHAPAKVAEKPVEKAAEKPAEVQIRYAVQLGSYPSAKEAQKKISVYSKRGFKSEMRTAVVNSETRYRVVVPGFKTLKQADARGKELKSARKIESFVIIKTE